MGESDKSPELKNIPEELIVFSESNNFAGLATLCFYVHEHRYPSYVEFENIMHAILAKQLQMSPVNTEAA